MTNINTIINEFLATWKEESKKYHIELNKQYEAFNTRVKEIKNEMDKETEKLDYSAEDFGDKYRALLKVMNAKKEIIFNEQKSFLKELGNAGTISIITNSKQYFEADLEKILNKEVEAKRKSFLSKITKITGENIIDSNLCIGVDGNLNGFVKGELGKCTVETIYAGGHNIQCLHYRVLVKKVK